MNNPTVGLWLEECDPDCETFKSAAEAIADGVPLEEWRSEQMAWWVASLMQIDRGTDALSRPVFDYARETITLTETDDMVVPAEVTEIAVRFRELQEWLEEAWDRAMEETRKE